MSSKSYKEIIQETISLLGGRATVFDIYDFVENNYKDFIKSKDPKTWRKIPTQEEVLQKEFEEALRFIDTNKEYQKIMLDYYLEF